MTTDERAAIRARAEAATPGPWWWHGHRPDLFPDPHPDAEYAFGPLFTTEGGCIDEADPEKAVVTAVVQVDGSLMSGRIGDLSFIAHARTDVPTLLDHADAQDRRVAELEALVQSLSERVHKQSELLSKRAEVQVP